MKLKVNFRECGRDPYSDVPHTHEGGLELIHVRPAFIVSYILSQLRASPRSKANSQ